MDFYISKKNISNLYPELIHPVHGIDTGVQSNTYNLNTMNQTWRVLSEKCVSDPYDDQDLHLCICYIYFTHLFVLFPTLLSSVAYWLERVKFWISNICCCFLQVGAVEKIKTNIQNSTSPNRWATEDIYLFSLSSNYKIYFRKA